MLTFSVDLSATSEDTELVRIVWEVLGYCADFLFNGEPFVELFILVELVNQKNLLSIYVHAMSSCDVNNEVLSIRVRG